MTDADASATGELVPPLFSGWPKRPDAALPAAVPAAAATAGSWMDGLSEGLKELSLLTGWGVDRAEKNAEQESAEEMQALADDYAAEERERKAQRDATAKVQAIARGNKSRQSKPAPSPASAEPVAAEKAASGAAAPKETSCCGACCACIFGLDDHSTEVDTEKSQRLQAAMTFGDGADADGQPGSQQL